MCHSTPHTEHPVFQFFFLGSSFLFSFSADRFPSLTGAQRPPLACKCKWGFFFSDDAAPHVILGTLFPASLWDVPPLPGFGTRHNATSLFTPPGMCRPMPYVCRAASFLFFFLFLVRLSFLSFTLPYSLSFSFSVFFFVLR